MPRTFTLLALAALIATACGGTKPTGFPTFTPSPSETADEEDTSTPEEPAEYDGVILGTEGNQFSPRYVSASAGTTVTWEQVGISPHNVAFDDGSFNSHPDCVGNLTAGCMGDGGTADFTFDEPGEYSYFCEVHGRAGAPDDPANMAGVVFVT